MLDPACGSGNPNMPASPLTNGMNLGILTLFVVIASVLGSIATFFVFIIRKEAALEVSWPNPHAAAGKYGSELAVVSTPPK